MLGVFGALASGLAAAPEGAWKGELIMIGAVLCMSVYNVLSRPFIQRSSALGFLAVGMGAGALALLVACVATGRVRSEEHTSELQSHHDLVCRLLLEKKK